MKIQETLESNIGTIYTANCDKTQFFKICDYVATFDKSKYEMEDLYGISVPQLVKTCCVKAKVVDLFDSYLLLGGNEENKLHFGMITIEYQNGETLTVHPNFYLLFGKVK